MVGPLRCVTLEETQLQHAILTAALQSGESGEAVAL
jgi:hypothetical protein